METAQKTITVSATINAPVEKVWELWSAPEHITKWNSPSPEWHTPRAENDLQTGGKFLSRMEAKDGSFGFDFAGEYTNVEKHKLIAYALGDGRTVKVSFETEGNTTKLTETFDPENQNPLEMQQAGWQAILDNFKKYAESLNATAEKVFFETTINAPAKHVYDVMLNEKTYSEWTAAFNPTSKFKGTWEKGSKILFIGEDPNGGGIGGMVSRIRENIPGKFVSIEHLGILKGEEEITTGPEVEAWAGALEEYTFTEENGKTIVKVANDTNGDFYEYLLEAWPKALAKLKEIAEA